MTSHQGISDKDAERHQVNPYKPIPQDEFSARVEASKAAANVDPSRLAPTHNVHKVELRGAAAAQAVGQERN